MFFTNILFCQQIIIEKKIEETLKKAFKYIDNDNDSAQIFIQKAKELEKKIKQPLMEVKILETEGNYFGFVKPRLMNSDSKGIFSKIEQNIVKIGKIFMIPLFFL